MLQFSILTIGTFVTLLDSISIYVGKSCFKKDIKKIIPILSIVYGIMLGIGGYYTPDVEMGNNLIEAIFIGLSAGAAATGINQISKQFGKDKANDINTVILYLKKLIDDINVPEDVNNEIPCDGDLNEDTTDIESSENNIVEDVPSDDNITTDEVSDSTDK